MVSLSELRVVFRLHSVLPHHPPVWTARSVTTRQCCSALSYIEGKRLLFTVIFSLS